MDANLERLKVLSGQLSGLMADPQPGLMTWNLALTYVLTDLAAYRAEQLRERMGASQPEQSPGSRSERVHVTPYQGLSPESRSQTELNQDQHFFGDGS